MTGRTILKPRVPLCGLYLSLCYLTHIVCIKAIASTKIEMDCFKDKNSCFDMHFIIKN